MLILAMDSCLQSCSAALADRASGEILASRWQDMPRGQAEAMPDMVDAVMTEHGDPYDKLAFIAVTRGPGSFTGVRIGLSFARALGQILETPVTSMTTLEAIARNVTRNPERLPLAAVIDARRGEVFMQVFDAAIQPLSGPQAIAVDKAASLLPPGPCLLTGSGADALADEAQGRIRADARPLPDAAVVALHAPIDPPPHGKPEPLYLRPPDAKPQKPLANMGE